MARRLRVYGAAIHLGRDQVQALLPEEPPHRSQVRAVVAAPSRKVAAEVFGVSVHFLSTYGSETGNEAEIEVAMSKPGALFVAPLDGRVTPDRYVEVTQ